MHEMSLAEGILQLVEETARREQSARVTAVCLEIGRLASVEVESLRFCFDAVVRDSVADGAKLEIVEVPGAGWCMDCDAPVAMADRLGACPQCGNYRVQVTGGTEMRVKEIEIA
jgi:hydrogenase nickel incorporation protein HypA/HybF